MSVFRGEATGIEDAVVGIEDPCGEPVVADELFYSLSILPDAIAPSRRITVARQDEAVARCRTQDCKGAGPKRRRFVRLVKDVKASQIGMETAVWGMTVKGCLP
jgi:hypothetical protein